MQEQEYFNLLGAYSPERLLEEAGAAAESDGCTVDQYLLADIASSLRLLSEVCRRR